MLNLEHPDGLNFDGECPFFIGCRGKKHGEKAEVLHAFFPSILNSKASCSQGTQPP